MDVSSVSAKESKKKSRFDSCSVRNSVLIISHDYLSFGIVACTFLQTTFLKIAVYKKEKKPFT